MRLGSYNSGHGSGISADWVETSSDSISHQTHNRMAPDFRLQPKRVRERAT